MYQKITALATNSNSLVVLSWILQQQQQAMCKMVWKCSMYLSFPRKHACLGQNGTGQFLFHWNTTVQSSIWKGRMGGKPRTLTVAEGGREVLGGKSWWATSCWEHWGERRHYIHQYCSICPGFPASFDSAEIWNENG